MGTFLHSVISYRPGSKNQKADALSQSFLPVQEIRAATEPILPPASILLAVSQRMQDLLQSCQSQAPHNTPQGRLFVPHNLRKKVLEECHSHPVAGHPGMLKTADLEARSFWWQGWHKDVEDFVASCSVCVQHKVPRSSPLGQLLPLPPPNRPWDHISMDFVVDLPLSAGCQVIWVIVDRFSKMTHFVPLARLPSAKVLVSLFI